MPARRFGKYQLIGRIGIGGMAEVYQATLQGAAGFTKQLAVKLLRSELHDEPRLVEMFIDEATIAAELNHPNIVTVHDFGELDGTFFLVMEYIDGWDLRVLQRRCQERQQPFPVDCAAYLVQELCRGLEYIHNVEQPIIHRDVTPHNVFVTRQGLVKLGDFGIAKTTARLTETLHGQIKGKLCYLAPEQVTHDALTVRTDVYAVGLVLFELLTGKRLIEGAREVDVIAAAADPPPIDFSMFREEAAPLVPVLERALQRHPKMRYPSAALLATDLGDYLAQQPKVYQAGDLARFAGEVAGDAAGGRPPQPVPQVPRVPRRAAEAPPVAQATQAGKTKLLRPQRRAAARKALRLIPYGLSVLAAVAAAIWFWPSAPPVPSSGLLVRSRVMADASQGPVGADARAGDSTTTAPPRESDSSIEHRRRAPSRRQQVRAVRGPSGRRARSRKVRAKRGDREEASQEKAPPATERHGPELSSGPTEAPRDVLKRQHRELATIIRSAHSRGLWSGDDPAMDRLARRIRGHLRAGQPDQAAPVLTQLRQRVDAFRIDRPFVERKLSRLGRAIDSGRLVASKTQRTEVFSQIVRLIIDERLVAASRLISQTWSKLSAPSGSSPRRD